MYGHKNWNHWIHKDERLCRQARSFAEQFTRDHAVKVMLRHLPEKTPDGAPYSFSSVRAAMKDII